MTYAEKLKDPRWQRKRLEVFQRDGWRCLSCGEDKLTLHVHHKKYEEGKDPWEVSMDFLMTLCESCHAKITGGLDFSYCGGSDFWPVILMSDGSLRKGPKAEIVGWKRIA